MSAAAPASGTIVIVPTYQEADNIEPFLRTFRSANPDVHVLVVDDSSPDGTADLARGLAEELGGIDVAVQATKGGLGTAYRHGMRIALERGYERIGQMDADLSHDPAVLPSMLAALTGDVAAVVGSRYVPGGSIPHWPWHRRMASKWGNAYTNWVLGIHIADTTAGLVLWRADAITTIGLLDGTSKGYLYAIENKYLLTRHGLRIAEVPITFTDRVRGTSKMNGAVVWEELSNVTWWGFRDRVLRRRSKPQ
jgi:dolichol-phosphate mannosyltransferase